MKFFKFKKQGSALITLSMLFVFLMGVILVVMQMQKTRASRQANAVAHLSIQAQMFNMRNILLNNDAWAETVNDIAANHTECLDPLFVGTCPASQEIKKVYDSAGNLVLDLSSSTAGFDSLGNVCNSYNSLYPSNSCPFRMKLSWEPVCRASCKNPGMVQVTFRVVYHPADIAQLGPINTDLLIQFVSREANPVP